MIEKIKKIKIDELSKKKEIDEKQRDIICKRLEELKAMELKSWGIVPYKEFSFIEKFFTARAEYKRFKNDKKIHKEKEKEKIKVEKKLRETGIKDRIEKMEEEINFIKDEKTTLKAMGFTPIEAMRFLEEKGIEPVLTEADKVIEKNPRDYSSKKGLIAVHKQMHKPTDSKLKTPLECKQIKEYKIIIKGKEYKIPYENPRNTVHFSINGEVKSHQNGDWDDAKYIVLTPLEDIPSSKIPYAISPDLFTEGGIDMTEDTWILCPQAEKKELKITNPNVHILGYEGKNSLGYGNAFLSQLGYHKENLDCHEFSDDKSEEEFRKLLDKEKIEWGSHGNTYYSENEDILANINIMIGISDFIKNNELLFKDPIAKNEIEAEIGKRFAVLTVEKGTTCMGMQYSNHPKSIAYQGMGAKILEKKMKEKGIEFNKEYENLLKVRMNERNAKWDEQAGKLIFSAISDSIEKAKENERKEDGGERE